LVALLYAAPAQAQTRTWVSGVGNDANPCSRTAPCKTFAGAISKTAANGEINCLDPGGFGAVTITKAITIACEGVTAGVLAAGTNGIIVNAGASDQVTLRGLDINGFGTGLNGIRFLAGKALIVDNCQIYEFTTHGIDVALGVSGSSLTVKDTRINRLGGVGIRVHDNRRRRLSVGGSCEYLSRQQRRRGGRGRQRVGQQLDHDHCQQWGPRLGERRCYDRGQQCDELQQCRRQCDRFGCNDRADQQ
jgi:hypothetical protein